MFETVESYLASLKMELRGSDPATRQDALADAEEHLRTALDEAQKQFPDKEEKNLLMDIINNYGSPEETADAYREIDRRLTPGLTSPTKTKQQTSMISRFFGIFVDPRAWGSLLFMLISLITGTLYFSWTVTGISTSLGVMILIIGIPIAVLFLLSFRGLALIEGRIVDALLGVRMPRRQRFFDPEMTWQQKIKTLFLGKDTWLSVIYFLLMLPLGTFYFSLVVSLLSVSLAFIAVPILQWKFHIPMAQFGTSTYYMPSWASPLFVLGGVLLLTCLMHLAKGIGILHGKLAKALLVTQ